MTKNRKIALATAGVALAGLVAAAGFAHADRGGGWGGHGWGHGHGRMMENMAERYDANKDGKISQEEIDTNRTATHGQFDADKDASLNLAEFEKLWLQANRERMVREFQRFDEDGDAKVTLDEYKKPLEGMVARADRDGDGMMGPEDRGGRDRMHHRRGDGPNPPPPAGEEPEGQQQ